jgi:hypothetical protein
MEKSPAELWSSERIGSLLTHLVRDAGDPLNLAHYRDRIGNYYPRDDREPIFTLLDILADSAEGVALEKLHGQVAAAHPGTPESRLPVLAELLEKDHYLERSGNEVRFASPIVREWWVYRRAGVSMRARTP